MTDADTTDADPPGARAIVPVPVRLPLRAAVAVRVVTAINRLSRVMGGGSGTVVGGGAGLIVDPMLPSVLSCNRRVALVSGTNGKTTATRLLAAAVNDGNRVPVATNDTGANMPAGLVAALVGSPGSDMAVLEVDESYLGDLVHQMHPVVLVLLNLSRDQLDRIAEVRMLVDRWRTALGRLNGPDEHGAHGHAHRKTVVVANADDPMVVWAASTAPDVRWVGAGQVWHEDAVGCPACGGRLVFGDTTVWSCDTCSFARPEREAWCDGDELVQADGTRAVVAIGLPGQFNRANAAMAAVAAPILAMTGRPVSTTTALERMAAVREVAGRFATVERGGHGVRLLLAKNPAGWTAIFDLLDETGDAARVMVLSVNARLADGTDTSWLWDVPFERLVGRTVLATGERCRDLAVRLRYAEVAHTVVPDPVEAVDTAIDAGPAGTIEFVGNYTAFAQLRNRL